MIVGGPAKIRMDIIHMHQISPSWFLIEISLLTVELQSREPITLAIGTTRSMVTPLLEKHSYLLVGVSLVRLEQKMTTLTKTVA